MKIATMVRAYLPAPRPADLVYAPIDLAMAICEGLEEKGHSVTFYGPLGSKPPVSLRHMDIEPLAHDYEEFQSLIRNTELIVNGVLTSYDYYYARDMFERARKGEFDLLHFHHPESALALAPLYPEVPVVYTLHDPIHPWKLKMFEMNASKNQFFVSISDSQRRPAPELPYIATVYNGIHLKDYEYSGVGGDYLLCAGRIVPEKGIAEAVQLSRRTNQKLIIAGPVFPDSVKYFNKRIKPYLNKQIRYLGYVERDKLAPYLRGSKAFLMPIKWEETFGVTMIEAMASGTPVVAFNRGSVCEVVKDGITGFIVKDIRGMAAAISKIDTIKRQDCRDYAAQNFTMQNMVAGYEQAFKNAIKTLKKS
ncbi:glycosyltransferase family 4 protein [soil metagenome]